MKDLNYVWIPRVVLPIIPPGKTCRFQLRRRRRKQLESIIGSIQIVFRFEAKYAFGKVLNFNFLKELN